MAHQGEVAGADTSAEADEDLLIVDADVHVNFLHEDIQREVAKRMDEPWKTRLDPDLAQGFRYPYPGHHWVGQTPGKDTAHTMQVTDPTEGIQEPVCEEFGVDYPILNLAPSFVDHLPTDRSLGQMRAMNDVLVERFLDAYDHFRGLATVSTKRPDMTAEEIDRLADEDQVVGLFIEAGGPEKPLGDSRYDVMWAAAEDNDLPVVTHAFSGAAGQWDFPVLVRDLENWLSVRTLAHPYGQMLHLTSLVYDGTVAKFPDLDWVFLEAGVGWLPYMLGRLNRGYKQRRDWAPLLEKTPEEYLRENLHIGTQPIGEPNDPSHVRAMIDMVGPDMLMFATDHPHYDFDYPDAMIDTYFGHFSREEQAKVLSGNAIDVFGLDV